MHKKSSALHAELFLITIYKLILYNYLMHYMSCHGG